MPEVVAVSVAPSTAPSLRVRLLLPRDALALQGGRLESLSLFPPDGIDA